jgi:hypothetical protein
MRPLMRGRGKANKAVPLSSEQAQRESTTARNEEHTVENLCSQMDAVKMPKCVSDIIMSSDSGI